MPPARAWPLLAAALFLTACGPATGGSPTSVPSPQIAPPTRVTSSPGPPSGTSSNPDASVATDAAIRDAAAHVGVSVTDVRVERVEPREWGDSSLGCPRPGIMYTQIVTPGYLIVVTAGGKTLEYHADARGRVVLCQET